MIKWFKRLLNLDNPTTNLSNEEYNELMKKVIDALMDGKRAIIKINNEPYVVSKESGFFGKVNITKMENK